MNEEAKTLLSTALYTRQAIRVLQAEANTLYPDDPEARTAHRYDEWQALSKELNSAVLKLFNITN